MQNKTQENERYYFGLFQKDYALPDGTIEYADKPDVILHGLSKIGIEITNFYTEDGTNPKSEQVQCRLRERVVSRAQAIFQKRSESPVRLILGFDPAVPLESDISRVAGQIADFAERMDRIKETGRIFYEEFSEIPELCFAWIVANGFGDGWTVQQVYSTPKMSIGRLREIVKGKEDRARGYTSCDKYWLLVVMDFINRAQDQNLHTEGFDSVCSDVFEKIIVYKTGFGHVLESR